MEFPIFEGTDLQHLKKTKKALAVSDSVPNQPKNHLLRDLPQHELSDICGCLEWGEMYAMEHCSKPGEALEHAFFPESGLISLVTVLNDGSSVETATVGKEGMTGVSLVLESLQSPLEVYCQINSNGWRLKAADLIRLEKAHPQFSRRVRRYTQNLINLIAQNNACNRLHSVEERFARWLVVTAERIESNIFPITQASLAVKLGVRRGAINGVATNLQKLGLITYTHGMVTIIDQVGLEKYSCGCLASLRNIWLPLD